MYHGRHPRRCQDFEPIGEWEKCIRGGHGSHGPLLIARERIGALHCQFGCIHPVDLPHAHAHGGAILGEQNRVGFDRPHGPPGKLQLPQ